MRNKVGRVEMEEDGRVYLVITKESLGGEIAEKGRDLLLELLDGVYCAHGVFQGTTELEVILFLDKGECKHCELVFDRPPHLSTFTH